MLGGSRELANLASSSYAGKEIVDELKDNTQLVFNGFIDSLRKTYPQFIWMGRS